MANESLRHLYASLTKAFSRDYKGSNDASVQEAITAWENDLNKNPKGNKIVRDLDGKPVEIILLKKAENPIFAVFANGKAVEQFQIGGEMQTIEQAFGGLRFEQFLNDDVFKTWYEIGGVQRLNAKVSKGHQGFVYGLPVTKPVSLQVRGVFK